MTTSRGVTIMKNVTSGLPSAHIRALTPPRRASGLPSAHIRSLTPPRRVSGTCLLGHNESAFAHLIAFLDRQTSLLEHVVDHFWGVERVNRRQLRRLGHQMLPTFAGGRVDVVYHRVTTRFERADKVTCV